MGPDYGLWKIVTQIHNFNLTFVSVISKCRQALCSDVLLKLSPSFSNGQCKTEEILSQNISASDIVASTSAQIAKVSKSISRVQFRALDKRMYWG